MPRLCRATVKFCYGSKAVFEADSRDVRFALDTRHWLAPIASGSLILRDPCFRVPVKSIQESPSKGTFAARQMRRSWDSWVLRTNARYGQGQFWWLLALVVETPRAELGALPI